MPIASPSTFQRLPEPVRHRLTQAGRERRFAPGERLVSLMDTSGPLLVIEEGLAKLTGMAIEGRERILYLYRPGAIVGLHVLMKKSQPTAFEVVAMTTVRSFVISSRDFLAASRDHPEVLHLVMAVLDRQLDRMVAAMLEMTSADAMMRLAGLLLDLAGDIPEGSFEKLRYSPTHQTMAQIIGASRPHTSTLLNRLEQRGAIKRLKPRGLLVCPAELKRVLQESRAQAAWESSTVRPAVGSRPGSGTPIRA